MADGCFFKLLNTIFSTRLADFDEFCMAMHISCFNPTGDHKFENPSLQTATILKTEKNVISRCVKFYASIYPPPHKKCIIHPLALRALRYAGNRP